MESTPVSLCKSMLDLVLSHAKSMVAEEVVIQLGVQGDVAIIAEEFEMMKYFLMTGDNSQDPSWVTRVRDLAYEVQDGLELLGAKVDQLEKPSRWRIPRILCERHGAAVEVKKLLDRVTDVAFTSKRSLYTRLVDGSGVDPATVEVAEQSEIFAAIAAIDNARHASAAGRDNSKIDLLQLIDDDLKDLRVIVLWGTSCDLQKISAVREAYSDGHENKKFGCRAWIKLASLSPRDQHLRNLVRQLSAEVIDDSSCARLETMVSKLLNENRFLIIIDGLLSTAEWDWIKTYFPDKRNRSRVIVSTRQVEIASVCTERPYQVFELKQSTSDHALYLFSKMVEPQQHFRESVSVSSTEAAVDEFITGRLEEQYELIDLISQPHDNHGCKVISVWGMGGIGKTTLVKAVYSSNKLDDLVQNRAWITMMRPFDILFSLRSIVMQLHCLTGRETQCLETLRLEELFNELNRLLGMQRSLVVLDDLSSTLEWDLMKKYLENAAVVIVTTRVKSVAIYCSMEEKNIYHIQAIADTEALNLFKRKVFKENESSILDRDMLEEAKLILKKCGGLPLAISVIGGFLSKRPRTVQEWKSINNTIGNNMLQMNTDLNSVRSILIKSYDSLPYHLKPCFLYMAIFPEDHKIRQTRLVRRWIAEGYSREMNHMTAEEAGERHFIELIDRSMVFPTAGAVSTGKISFCHLHDLILEICVSKSVEEELVFTLEQGCSSNPNNKVRHLAVSNNWVRDKDVFDSIRDISGVRSLTVFGEWRSYFLSSKIRLLRVLDLEDASGLAYDDLNQICKLIHLRYLSLRGCGSIFHMPDSLANLRHLQTLDIRGTKIFHLPTTIIKLKSLQHLNAPAWFKGRHEVESFIANEHVTDSLKIHGKFKLSCCYSSNFHLLSRDASRVDHVPRGFGKLSALRTLGYVRIAQGNASAEELKELTQLRKLALQGIDKTNSRGFWSAICSHHHLRTLSVNRNFVADGLDCYLDGSLSPPKFLETLKLWGSLVRVTEWIHQLQNLTKLQLQLSRLGPDDLGVLGKLPKLSILRLWESSFQEEQLKFEQSSFPSLILLEFRELYAVEMVYCEDGAMPKLELLQVAGWSKLQGFSGLRSLASLKEFHLGPDFSEEFIDIVRRELSAIRNNPILKVASDGQTSNGHMGLD